MWPASACMWWASCCPLLRSRRCGCLDARPALQWWRRCHRRTRCPGHQKAHTWACVFLYSTHTSIRLEKPKPAPPVATRPLEAEAGFQPRVQGLREGSPRELVRALCTCNSTAEAGLRPSPAHLDQTGQPGLPGTRAHLSSTKIKRPGPPGQGGPRPATGRVVGGTGAWPNRTNAGLFA